MNITAVGEPRHMTSIQNSHLKDCHDDIDMNNDPVHLEGNVHLITSWGLGTAGQWG